MKVYHLSRIAGGKKIEHKAIHDDLSFMTHLGLVSATTEGYEPL